MRTWGVSVIRRRWYVAAALSFTFVPASRTLECTGAGGGNWCEIGGQWVCLFSLLPQWEEDKLLWNVWTNWQPGFVESLRFIAQTGIAIIWTHFTITFGKVREILLSLVDDDANKIYIFLNWKYQNKMANGYPKTLFVESMKTLCAWRAIVKFVGRNISPAFIG